MNCLEVMDDRLADSASFVKALIGLRFGSCSREGAAGSGRTRPLRAPHAVQLDEVGGGRDGRALQRGGDAVSGKLPEDG